MTSSNTIKIDWSATPASSFIQIDAYTRTPIADLYNYKPSHTYLNVLTTKDILTYDIDIYLKFYKRSLPLEDTLPSQVSTDKVDTPSSSNIPITTSCDHDTSKETTLNITPSNIVDEPIEKDILPPVPSPITLSNNRHACGLHFSKIYQEIMNSFNKKNDDETGPINSKITHANLLHARWSSKYKKQVVSLRTGRSYQVHYSARDLYDIKDSTSAMYSIPTRLPFFNSLRRNKRTRIGAETYTRSRNQAILENGTTERHYDLRMGMKRCLTALTDYYHDGIRNYDDYTEFMRVYRDKIRSYHDINNKFLGTKKGRLTADTIRAKIRPNKRDCSSTYNIDRDLSSSIVKKPRHGDCPRDLLIKHDILNM
ncbi:unnamed protein product [Rhizophagus irregularis]|nr:unnamed protein product [Rhizophagus irregularis]